MPQKIILDVDPGRDDTLALMVAALHPAFDLLGVTTVNGNRPVHECTENTLRVFDYIGVQVPVYEGCALPLVATMTSGRKPDIPRQGNSAVHGDYLDLPPATSRKQRLHAVDFVISSLLASEGDIILVPVGPLTNIAMAIKKEPRILPKIKELVIMGGGHEAVNTGPAAEWNIWVDPEAARIVLNCGRPIRLVPLDATHRALLSRREAAALRNVGTPASKAAAMFIDQLIDAHKTYQQMDRPDTAPMHDVLCLIAMIEPSVIATEYLFVDVETNGGINDGRTVCDRGRRSLQSPNVHVALNADEPRFVEILIESLSLNANQEKHDTPQH